MPVQKTAHVAGFQPTSILPYTNAEWEKLSIFLQFLVTKLPAPKEEDLSRGIHESSDMDSYRVEKQAGMRIALPMRTPRLNLCPQKAADTARTGV